MRERADLSAQHWWSLFLAQTNERLRSHHKMSVVDEENFAFMIMSQETRFCAWVGHQPAMWPLDSGYPSLSLSCLNSKMSQPECR